ncbi:hypothetical protein BC831DRAFT_457040 [Entophlyctis helioformis]|nr:hypothetical protein BC831DRAFT_457040 [Entophlyctis helioformis]
MLGLMLLLLLKERLRLLSLVLGRVVAVQQLRQNRRLNVRLAERVRGRAHDEAAVVGVGGHHGAGIVCWRRPHPLLAHAAVADIRAVAGVAVHVHVAAVLVVAHEPGGRRRRAHVGCRIHADRQRDARSALIDGAGRRVEALLEVDRWLAVGVEALDGQSRRHGVHGVHDVHRTRDHVGRHDRRGELLLLVVHVLERQRRRAERAAKVEACPHGRCAVARWPRACTEWHVA